PQRTYVPAHDIRVLATGARGVEVLHRLEYLFPVLGIGGRANGLALGALGRVEPMRAGRRSDPRVERGQGPSLVGARPRRVVRCEQIGDGEDQLLARHVRVLSDPHQVPTETWQNRIRWPLAVGPLVSEATPYAPQKADRFGVR